MRIIRDQRLEEIIRKCCKGDSLAQKQLYAKFSPTMYGLCLRYTRNEQDAQDVLQEGFIKVYTKLNTYKGDGSFEGWMKRIFIHNALRFLTQKKKYDFNEIIEDNEQHLPVFTAPCEYEDLLCMVSQLPDGYRSVFNLSVIDGYKHNEIGALLGISENTSRSQLTRAKAMLRKMINNNESKLKEQHGRV